MRLLDRPTSGMGELQRLVIMGFIVLGLVGVGVKKFPVLGVLVKWFELVEGLTGFRRLRSLMISFIVMGCWLYALNHGPYIILHSFRVGEVTILFSMVESAAVVTKVGQPLVMEEHLHGDPTQAHICPPEERIMNVVQDPDTDTPSNS